MHLALHIVLALVLLTILVQDFRSRAIYWWLPVVLFLVAGACSVWSAGWGETLHHGWYNAIFVSLLLGVLFLYSYLRYKSFRSLLTQQFGLGDVLMLLALCPLFGSVNFILFICFSNVLMLFIELLKRLIRPGPSSIAYAGYLAGFTLVFQVLTFFVPAVNFMTDFTGYFLFSPN